eukprot:4497014-Amphidinium_carterae.1
MHLVLELVPPGTGNYRKRNSIKNRRNKSSNQTTNEEKRQRKHADAGEPIQGNTHAIIHEETSGRRAHFNTQKANRSKVRDATKLRWPMLTSGTAKNKSGLRNVQLDVPAQHESLRGGKSLEQKGRIRRKKGHIVEIDSQ